ncbi:hypothetical protein NL676_003682 [Syzygium grande]|nr:hypothetical protein NL676_003682 [Syzygium grande]
MQKEYMLAKSSRYAAAKAKMEAKALSVAECHLHVDNEWNISDPKSTDAASSAITRKIETVAHFLLGYILIVLAPSVGRTASEPVAEAEVSDELNGVASTEPRAPLTSAQRLAISAASAADVSPDPFGLEAKHFTEIRVLNRDVRIVLEGVDKFSNLIGSVFYSDSDSAKDLALELLENGLAKYVEWSANMMEEEAKRRLKAAELQAKKSRLRFWTNYVPPSNSKAICDQNFSGTVVEVVSGDCIVVADDSAPYGSSMAERRVNLSSIRCPKLGNPRKDEKPAPFAREAMEFLRTRLIGKQVKVLIKYSRKVGLADGASTAADSRVMDFGSVFLVSPLNVDVMMQRQGHRDFEERSNYYDCLLAAEARAISGRKGMHSSKDPPVMHITDLVTASAKKASDFLPFLQRSRRVPAVVEYVLSGHRFKLLIPKETCSIAFSFSGVRCPGRDEPFSDEAIALMRRKIMQRDVEIEVETVDRTGTFLGSLWESKKNVAITLLEAGLAKLQTSFGGERIPDAHLLQQAEQVAKRQKLKVVVTEVLGGGKFYVQTVGDQKVLSIQRQVASLNLQDAPLVGAFNPRKGDTVLAQFSADNSWNRAMSFRPLDPSLASSPGLAQLCSLAFVKVPTLDEDFGQEAAVYLSELTLSSSEEFKATVEERDTSGGKVKGQGTGTVIMVTLCAADSDLSINAAMVKDGKEEEVGFKQQQMALDNLEKYQAEARTDRLNMWQYGDIESDDEDVSLPLRKGGGGGGNILVF